MRTKAKKVRKFLKELQTDPNIHRLARNIEPPANDEEAVDGYIRLAEELGHAISREEMAEGLKTLAQEQRKQSEQTGKTISIVDEEELDKVAGGFEDAWYPTYCKDQFVEGQWCWYADSCSQVINDYGEVINGLRK